MIEILHTRNPDFECAVEVWVDGVKMLTGQVVIEDVDPGAGHTRADWLERIEDARAYASPSSPFRTAIVAALEAEKDSKWLIDDDGSARA